MLDRTGSALARISAGPLALADGWIDWAEDRAERALSAASQNRVAGAVAWDAALDARRDGWKPYDVRDGVALIGVQGLILPDFCLVGWGFATGCAQLRWQVREAAVDEDVRAIALMVDSPGGFAIGVDETANAILEAREEKPVAAIVEAHAFSAAYWIAGAADTISAPRTGGLGHVGVLTLHLDMTGWLEAEGVKPTLFRSGARKADGHPLEPMSEEAARTVQAEIDSLRGVFAAAVAQGRRDAIDEAGVLATEARAYQGPDALEEARRLGLFDAILPAEQALDLFVQGVTAGDAG